MFPRVTKHLRTFIALIAFAILSFGAFYLRNGFSGNSIENLEELIANAPGKLLLIDLDCLKRIAANLECNFPLRLAVTSHFSEHLVDGTTHLFRLEFLFDDDDDDQGKNKDYWLFHPIRRRTKATANRNDGSRGRRAVRRFNTTTAYSSSAHLRSFFPLLSTRLDVPSQIPAFLRAWQNGKFFDCANENGEPILKRTAALPPKIPPNFSANIAAYSEFIARFNGTVFLLGGTLLGWRRECSFIPHTYDVDLGMLVEEHSESLFRALLASDTFILGYILGHLKKGIVLWTYVDGIKIDLFYVYTNRTRSKSFVAGFRDVPPRRILHWVYPQIREICAGELHGHLIHLPCNFDGILQGDYGADWSIDIPTSKYNYKYVERGQIITDDEYEKLNIPVGREQKKNKTVIDAWLAQIGVI